MYAPTMEIGRRVRQLRQAKKLSQRDIEKSTGLLRAYLSRVENGHTVPNIATLEKLARALDMPLYKLMCEGEELLEPIKLEVLTGDNLWGSKQEELSELKTLRRHLAHMDDAHRRPLLLLAAQMALAPGRR
jgi:transcriptional regulator with XRE-family HTH domain